MSPIKGCWGCQNSSFVLLSSINAKDPLSLLLMSYLMEGKGTVCGLEKHRVLDAVLALLILLSCSLLVQLLLHLLRNIFYARAMGSVVFGEGQAHLQFKIDGRNAILGRLLGI